MLPLSFRPLSSARALSTTGAVAGVESRKKGDKRGSKKFDHSKPMTFVGGRGGEESGARGGRRGDAEVRTLRESQGGGLCAWAGV